MTGSCNIFEILNYLPIFLNWEILPKPPEMVSRVAVRIELNDIYIYKALNTMSEFDKHSKNYIIIIILQFPKLFYRYYFITYLIGPYRPTFCFFLRIKNDTSINILEYKA